MNSGSYLILIQLEKGKRLEYGRHQRYFRPGYFVYLGSAMRNLRQRVGRHLDYCEGNYQKHWHIDNLLQHGHIVASFVLPSLSRHEAHLSRELSRHFTTVPGFGASDLEVDSNLFELRRLEDFYSLARTTLFTYYDLQKSIDMRSDEHTYQH